MLSWILTFLIAPIFYVWIGITGIAAEPSDFAGLFGVFLVVVLGIWLVWRQTRGRRIVVRK